MAEETLEKASRGFNRAQLTLAVFLLFSFSLWLGNMYITDLKADIKDLQISREHVNRQEAKGEAERTEVKEKLDRFQICIDKLDSKIDQIWEKLNAHR